VFFVCVCVCVRACVRTCVRACVQKSMCTCMIRCIYHVVVCSYNILQCVVYIVVQAQQVAVLESEALRLKEEVKQLSSLLEAAKKSKTSSEERLEELRALVSKVSTYIPDTQWDTCSFKNVYESHSLFMFSAEITCIVAFIFPCKFEGSIYSVVLEPRR